MREEWLESSPCSKRAGGTGGQQGQQEPAPSLGSQGTKHHPGWTRHSMASRSREEVVPLCSALCGFAWSAVCGAGPHRLRRVGRSLSTSRGRATQLVAGLAGMCCGEQLRTLALSRLERRGLKGSWLSAASWRGDVAREVLSSSPWDPGPLGMSQSCAGGGSD